MGSSLFPLVSGAGLWYDGPRRAAPDLFDFQSEVHMNEKEIGELRRRFRADKSNITHVRGCYVNEKKEIIS